jgi:hypothetical protein
VQDALVLVTASADPVLQHAPGTRWGAVVAVVSLFAALLVLALGALRVAGVRVALTPVRIGGAVLAVALFALLVIPR